MTPAELFPVVEMCWLDGPSPFPWAVAPDWDSGEHRRLSARLTDAEVGSVAVSLAVESGIDPGPDPPTVLAALATADYLSLRGGLAIESDGRVICPGCCTSLGEWREWLGARRTGRSPWMGHDPAPRVEWGTDVVRVWSDGGIGPAPDAFAIDFPRADVEAQLDRVAADLRDFADRLAGWAAGLGAADAARLGEQFWRWFGPHPPPDLPPDPPDDEDDAAAG